MDYTRVYGTLGVKLYSSEWGHIPSGCHCGSSIIDIG